MSVCAPHSNAGECTADWRHRPAYPHQRWRCPRGAWASIFQWQPDVPKWGCQAFGGPPGTYPCLCAEEVDIRLTRAHTRAAWLCSTCLGNSPLGNSPLVPPVSFQAVTSTEGRAVSS